MDRDLWKTHCEAAVCFLNANIDSHYIGVTDGDKQFASKWEKIKIFRLFVAIDEVAFKKALLKIPAPVLTRWWTVGETARVTWNYYLLLY